ncbi:CLUMA_CG009334, isoform A [Clunio marinus]|uniref:CLUMA_CG009334, isoform A n=1 Tax=Clunio marinus TaxID=568069 RepID=A0A1J1I6K0_9DIPT|nr:CLUMA_CG009334, isoform A [Clunio marinus]
MIKIAILLMAVAMVFGAPEAKPDPKPQFLAYSAPLVASSAYVPSAVYERSYHGNFAYPYVAAPAVVASPYSAAYTAPILVR